MSNFSVEIVVGVVRVGDGARGEEDGVFVVGGLEDAQREVRDATGGNRSTGAFATLPLPS